MKTSLCWIGCVLLLGAVAYGDGDIRVNPLDYDFGVIDVGMSDSVIITIYNDGDTTLTVTDVSFQAGSSADFAITSFLYPPIFMGPGGQFPIQVTFTPSAGGPASAVLVIESNDADQPVVEVSLSGAAPDDDPTPEEQIAAIIEFVEDSVADGTLQGDGPGKSADNRLRALQNMLDRAQELIDEGLIEEAIHQLESVYKKTDGQERPGDFVTGDAAADLAEMILELLNTLYEM